MKNNFPKIIALFSLVVLGWACDNGFSDVPVVDTPPRIALGSITSGLTEGEDFRIEVTLSDGVDQGQISTLASLSYAILQGGTTITSGSEPLSGDQQTVPIVISGGFEPGEYSLDLVATDSNGNKDEVNLPFTVASSRPAFDITGTWRMEPVGGSMTVGPAAGSAEWWQISDGDVSARACFYDDTYTFNEDGSFSYDMGEETWLETWQGVEAEGCGAPVAPFDGSGSYTYTYTTTNLTLIGEGAHVGLSKVNNAGEISNGVAIANQVSYTIVEQSQEGENRRMTLRIEAGSGVWWDFKLISGPPATAAIVGRWKIEPVGAALAVGPTAGSTEWWSNSGDDVTTRACFFDDVYTFAEDGSFSIDMGTQTWLETWQGVDAEGCGTPVAPHDGSGTFTYEYSGSTLKLIGTGAHVGLPKAVNAGELPNVAVPGDVTYQVASLSEEGGVKRLILHIETGSGVWWSFKLIPAE